MITVDDLNYKQKNVSFEVVSILDKIQKHIIEQKQSNEPKLKSKFYTGVGSREEKCQKYSESNHINLKQDVIDIGIAFASQSYILRSGGATGMDSYFETGVTEYIQKYTVDALAYFESDKSLGQHIKSANQTCAFDAHQLLGEIYYAKDADRYNQKVQNELLFEMVKLFHPAPQYLKKNSYPIKRLARNIFQLFGYCFLLNEDKLDFCDDISRFVICFTPDGCISHSTRNYNTGGTGQLISYADFFGVPVYNLGNKEQMSYQRLMEYSQHNITDLKNSEAAKFHGR